MFCRRFPYLLLGLILFHWSCDAISTPFDMVTRFDDIETAILYHASEVTPPPMRADTLLVMTWNIRFGAARLPWFGDSCGDRAILTEREVTGALQRIANKLNEVDPDILLMQEVDRQSKRTGYIDEIQWVLDHTNFNYGAYASAWQAQFIPSDGLGRMDMGNVILSRWRIEESARIALPLREDQDALTQYFYLRRNIIRVKIDLPGYENFYVLNVHASAFSTDDTKERHIIRFKDELDKVDASGGLFVAGGDLNELPPSSDSTNYCEEDRCSEDPEDFCRDGSDFTTETDWLDDLYVTFQPAVPLSDYLTDSPHYFTHSVGTNRNLDRKLDYLFTNVTWVSGSDSTHQDATELSDHVPVTARVMLSP